MIDPPPLYLAFCDGAFDFDCRSCNALCCRGAGFAGSMTREVPRLLELYPALASLAISRQGDVVFFANPSNGCYFLDSDNFCRIERGHGRALKPGVCGLFPFNSFLRIGETIAIRPHFLCPLRAVLPPRPGEVEGTHTSVERAAGESGLLSEAFVKTHLSPAELHPSMDARATVEREAALRDLSAELLERARFHELLATASSDAVTLADHVRRASVLLGLGPDLPDAPRGEIDDLLLLLAAPLRTSFLRLSGEGILVALALGERLFLRALSLGTAPSLSSAWELISRLSPALRLLGRLEEPIVPDPTHPPRIPAFSDPTVALAASVALRADPATGTLSALERAIPEFMPAADRSILLCTLGAG